MNKSICLLIVISLVLILPLEGKTERNSGDKQETQQYIKINPEFKVSRTPKGSVMVSPKHPDNENINHEFSDFYADLIMAAYRKQALNLVENTLRKKYYMSEDDCRREIKHALNVLTEWKIVIIEGKS